METSQRVKFWYTNHRGEISERDVTLMSLDFDNNPGHNYSRGWFLTGYDHDKKAIRLFAVGNFVVDNFITAVSNGTHHIARSNLTNEPLDAIIKRSEEGDKKEHHE